VRFFRTQARRYQDGCRSGQEMGVAHFGTNAQTATLERASGRIVVLAANGIENPRAPSFLRMRLRPSDKVGRYLMDHPIKQSFALAPNPGVPVSRPNKRRLISRRSATAISGSVYAGFKTSIKNDGWSTTKTGSPRGNFISAQGPNRKIRTNNGTILDFVEKLGSIFGTSLRDKLRDHTTRTDHPQQRLRAASGGKPIASLFRQIMTVWVSQSR